MTSLRKKRARCNIRPDPDAISESGEPYIFHMRDGALAIEIALSNAGFEIVEDDHGR